MPGEGVEPSDRPPHKVIMAHGFTDRDGEHPTYGRRDGIRTRVLGFADRQLRLSLTRLFGVRDGIRIRSERATISRAAFTLPSQLGGPDGNRTHHTDLARVRRPLGTCQPTRT